MELQNGKKEQPRYVDSHRIDETHSSKHPRLPHTHEDFLELFYVRSGAGQYMVDHQFYEVQQGDIVICNAGVLHGEDPALRRRMCSYSVAITGVCLTGLPENWLVDAETCPVIPCGRLAGQVGPLFEQIYLLSGGGASLSEVCSGLAYALLQLTLALLRQSRKRQRTVRQESEDAYLAQRIERYLDAHHREQLTLDEVAEQLHISKFYLAHVFKETFGMPPMQYVMKRRIGEAQGLLMDTALPIAEISDRLGFCSPCHFNTAFGKYVGMPPGQYRQSFQICREEA